MASQPEVVATENVNVPNTTETPVDSSSKSSLKSKTSKTSVKTSSTSLKNENNASPEVNERKLK